jgi:hypothetical protein
MSLESYARNLYAPQKFVDVSIVVLQATFLSGASTRDADNSSPDTTIADDTTGDYDITFPAGTGVHVLGMHLDNGDDTPDGADAHIAVPCDISADGTGKVLILATDDGLVAAPDDGARLFVTLLVFNQ